MKRLLWVVVAVLCFGVGMVRASDWLTDGGDNQRSGWQKDEHILTAANVKDMKILWTYKTDNQVRALHSLMPALVVDNVQTSSGPKQIVIFTGISDNIYALNAADGSVIWKQHYTYTPMTQPARGGGGGGQPQPSDPAKLNFLGPGGSSDTPVIGQKDAQGRWPVYWVDGGGFLHTINLADGTEIQAPIPFAPGKGWALNLINNIIYMPTGGSVHAIRLDDPEHNVASWADGSGGMWGRRGVVVDSHGIAWSTTGDGVYDVDSKRYGNSVVGVQLSGVNLNLHDYYTPTNWEWLQKRDLDPNNTPTIFNYGGKEIMAASGKECRVVLLDTSSAGGADHQTPLYKTEPFCNEEVDFQDRGSWGALSSWLDPAGVRWVIAPFWGPQHSKFKFPITNTPPTAKGGVAAFKVVTVNGKIQLAPVWVSRDMDHGEPAIIANGMIFTYGSGDFTQQASPEHGLDFDSSIRAAKAAHATLYVLDAQTGKELFSSGDQIKSFNHFSGVTVANGHVYLGTYDGTFYCFGLPGH